MTYSAVHNLSRHVAQSPRAASRRRRRSPAPARASSPRRSPTRCPASRRARRSRARAACGPRRRRTPRAPRPASRRSSLSRRRRPLSRAPGGRGVAAAVLAGQQPAREREVREEADPELARDAAAPPPRRRGGAGCTRSARDDRPSRAPRRGRLLEMLGARSSRADLAHLALGDELVERAERLVDRRRRRRDGGVVEVDVVGAEPPSEASIARAHVRRASRPARRRSSPPMSIPNFVATTTSSRAARERLAEELLAVARAVDVGGVEERDAGVERGVDDRRRASRRSGGRSCCSRGRPARR